MKPRLLEILRCPHCQARLALLDAEESAGEIVSGALVSPCGLRYPVVRSIPRFVPSDNYASNFGFQWNEFRQTQLDSTSGVPISRGRFLRETGWSGERIGGKLVLDAGCGAGRFAEIALYLGAEVVAIDYSDAVDAAQANLGSQSRFHAVQADVYRLPFSPGTFDFVYSLGVLQHTPDAWAAVRALVGPLKAGGEIAVDFYLRRWTTLLQPKYWLRPFTRRIPARRLFAFLQRLVPGMLRASRRLKRIPVAGRYAARLVPVADYAGVYPLSERQLAEWALLDTFDWLAPRYDRPQSARTLRKELSAAGLVDVEVFRADHLTGRGRKQP